MVHHLMFGVCVCVCVECMYISVSAVSRSLNDHIQYILGICIRSEGLVQAMQHGVYIHSE